MLETRLRSTTSDGGTLSIGPAVIGGTPGSVLFVDTSGNLGQDNAVFNWDATNNSLGIGQLPTAGSMLSISSTSLKAGLVVSGASGQVVSVFEVYPDNQGFPAFAISATGVASFNPDAQSTYDFVVTQANAESAIYVDSSLNTVLFGNSNTDLGSQVGIIASATGDISLAIRQLASQTGDLFLSEMSDGTDIFTITPSNAAATPVLQVKAYADSADSVQARFSGPNRSVAANNDRFSWEFYLDDSAENQAHFAEIEFIAQTVNSAGRFGGIIFYAEANSSNVQIVNLGASVSGGTGFLFNNSRVDMDFDINGDNTLDVYKMDASLDANQFTVTSTRASAAGMTWDGMDVLASTLTVTGTTAVTNATGVNLFDIKRPTITDSSAVTITAAATVRIADAPLAAGSVTITSPYALWVDAGQVKFDGSLIVDGSTRINGGFGLNVSPQGAQTGWSVTNVTEDKTYDADSTTLGEIADVLGTLITRLIAMGVISA